MLRLFRLSAILVLAALLGACAGPVPKIDATEASLARISTITVIRPPEPKKYVVANLGHPGMAFGLIGGIIAGLDMNSKQDQITAALRKENISVHAGLADGLVGRLTAEGYRVTAADGPWEEHEGRYTLKFDQIQADTDAVLVIVPTIVGFVDGGFVASTSGSYVPTIASVVTLLDRDHKTILYRGYHVTGWKPSSARMAPHYPGPRPSIRTSPT